MNDSPSFVRYKTILRLSILAVSIVSLLGPWMLDLINVPAEYECDKPFVRLEGDFCGLPMSGILFLQWFLVTGLSLLLLMPFVTTILLLWKKETPRLRTINLIAWILALLPTLTIFIFQIKDQAFRLWGLWLYILVAVGAVVFEVILLKRKTDRPV